MALMFMTFFLVIVLIKRQRGASHRRRLAGLPAQVVPRNFGGSLDRTCVSGASGTTGSFAISLTHLTGSEVGAPAHDHDPSPSSHRRCAAMFP